MTSIDRYFKYRSMELNNADNLMFFCSTIFPVGFVIVELLILLGLYNNMSFVKNNIIKFIFLLGLIVPTVFLQAQQINNLYFIENAPVRHYLNPALQPLSGFYLGFPVLGYTQFGVGNNSFTVSALATPKLDVLNSLKPTTLLNTDLQFNILDFGFRNKNAYWNVGITEKINIQVGLPEHLFELMMFGAAREVNGVTQLENNIFDFKTMSLGAQAYTEAALGYSRLLNDKWSIGTKLKFLYGLANLSASFENFELITGIDELKINANGTLNGSTPLKVEITNALDNIKVTKPNDVADYFKPYGMGGAIDFGITFKPYSFLTLGAAVNDLGFIRWNKNTNKMNFRMDYSFDGVYTFTYDYKLNGIKTEVKVDSIMNNIKKSITTSFKVNTYTTNTIPKTNVSAEIEILKNTISLGLLSSTMFYNNNVYQDITTSLNLRPANWFNIALSYSLLNGRGRNIGAGLGFRIGLISTFITTDYIPLNLTRIPLSALNVNPIDLTNLPLIGKSIGVIDNVKLPYKTDRLNFAIGFNIVFGNKLDKDNDGISNRRIKCKNTPKNANRCRWLSN